MGTTGLIWVCANCAKGFDAKEDKCPHCGASRKH